MHISDLQNLASRYPDTYEYTFSYLDSIRDEYNISAIIFTGDLVNNYNDKKQWDVYARSIEKTDIPVYVIAGNHDTNWGTSYSNFFRYTGNDDDFYVTSINDFNLIGIDYAEKTRSEDTFNKIRDEITKSSLKFNIIATHYYMESDTDRSKLGEDIFDKLIDRPTIIMAGHVHSQIFRVIDKDGKYPVIEDIANYQDGYDDDDDDSGRNVSAGVLYTVTTDNGMVDEIVAQEIRIIPAQEFGEIQRIYKNETG
ncbi:metallophosphoesterase family protein [Methanospirillum stamsii]|uniref:metallophosphoesterase family protein n=1 Tax=Methanospirillum stamsii TaxID=1277351 RepID=UPI0039082CD3